MSLMLEASAAALGDKASSGILHMYFLLQLCWERMTNDVNKL